MIQDLDPFLSYSVSVAAINAAGMGDYSNEVTLESKCFLVIEKCAISIFAIYTFCST